MRLASLAPAVAVVSLGVSLAHAQDAASPAGFDPAAAIEGFLTDADLFAATSATVGSVATEGGTVRASDVTMRWTADVGTPEAPVNLEASVTMPTLEVTGLAPKGERWSADRIAMPEFSVSVALTGGPEALSYALTARDYVITDADWGKLPQIRENAAAPVSRFAPLIDWAIDQSYARATIAGIDGRIEMPDSIQTITYGAIDIGPVANGVTENFVYGAATSTQSVAIPSTDPDAPFGTTAPMEVTMEIGASRGTGVDARPLAQLLTGTGDATGPQTVIGTTVTDGLTMTFGDMASASIGPSVTEGLTIDPTRGPLLTAIDGIVVAGLNGAEPAPEDIIGLTLDVYGAFGLERYSLASVDVTFTGGQAKMAEFLIEGLSAAGLERFALTGVDVAAEGTTARLGTFEVADVVFPARDAFLSMVMGSMAGMEPNFQTIATAVPLLGRMTIDDALFENPAMGTFRIGAFETRLENYVNAIPTRATINLTGFSMPVAMLPDPSIQAAAQQLGLTDIAANGTVALGWDADTQRIELDNDIAVDGVGRLEASAALAGIPAYIFEDPARAQEALATAALVGLEASFLDQGITNYVVDLVAAMSGVSPQEFADGIVAQAQMQIGMLTGDQALGQQVSTALSAYLSNPQSLRIGLAPQAPVPVAQVMGAAMTAPQTIPALLNFSIGAN